LDKLAHKARLVHKAFKVQLGLLVPLDLREFQVPLDQKDKLDLKD
jgi:hypothetical protein